MAVRLINRVLALIIALALIALGVFVIAEVVVTRLGRPDAVVHYRRAYDWAQRTHWNAGAVRGTFIIMGAVGLVLLLLELKRSRPRRLTTTADDPATDAAYTRRGVAAALRSAVTDVDGVRGAQVSVGRRRVRVHADAAARDQSAADQLRDSVNTAAQDKLAALQLHPQPKLQVNTTARAPRRRR